MQQQSQGAAAERQGATVEGQQAQQAQGTAAEGQQHAKEAAAAAAWLCPGIGHKGSILGPDISRRGQHQQAQHQQAQQAQQARAAALSAEQCRHEAEAAIWRISAAPHASRNRSIG